MASLRHIFCLFAALSLVSLVLARRGGGFRSSSHSRGGGSHSYPSSHGYSGHGTGHSNTGGGHTYPHSGSGMSGNNQPSHGGGHSYPQSPGLSGNNQHNSGGGFKPGGASYPHSNGYSGASHNYNYQPPQQIHYAPSYGSHQQTYPVYNGPPPTYVYQYSDSGSRFSTLLTGLALYNLGRGALPHNHDSKKSTPGEVCKMQIINGKDFEETIIPCYIVSTFFGSNSPTTSTTKPVTLESNHTSSSTVSSNNASDSTSTTTVAPQVSNSDLASNTTTNETSTSTVETTEIQNNATENTNATLTDETNSNNTLHSVTSVDIDVNGTSTTIAPTTPSVSNVTDTTTVTAQNVTQSPPEALSVKGPPINVTSDMECYVLRKTPSTTTKKGVPCELLQQYAVQSIKRNSKGGAPSSHASLVTVLLVSLSAFLYV